MSRERMTALMKDLAAELKFEDLALNEDHCRLQSDDGALTLDLNYAEKDDLLVLSCPLGSVAPGRDEAVLSALLSANCFWGETAGRTLSLNPAGEVLLQDQIRVADLEGLSAVLERFAVGGKDWMERLQDLNRSPEQTLDSAPPRDTGTIRG